MDDGPGRPRGRRQLDPAAQSQGRRRRPQAARDRRRAANRSGAATPTARSTSSAARSSRSPSTWASSGPTHEGRLLFLGGHGVSASPSGTPIFDPNDPNRFINADGWYDDMSDGPVTAEVNDRRPFDPRRAGLGRHRPARLRPEPSRRPDALRPAPGPLHRGRLAGVPGTDLVPRRRLSDPPPLDQPAVGEPGIRHPVRPGRAERLRGPGLSGQAGGEARARRHRRLRRAAPPGAQLVPRPRRHRQQRLALAVGLRRCDGPAPGEHPAAECVDLAHASTRSSRPGPRACSTPTGGPRARAPAAHRAGARSPDQPAMLDRAAIEFCLADAFHPGCEVTWPIRHLTMYHAPFRIRHRPAGEPEPDYGTSSPRRSPSARNGPLYAPGAGRPDAVDGAALAGRHRLLPLGLRHRLRPLRPDVLAGPRAQPGAHRAELSPW